MLIDLKRDTDSNTTIVRDINNPLTSMDRSVRQTQQGSNRFRPDDRTNGPNSSPNRHCIYFYSSIPGTFSRIRHFIGHKTSFSKFQKTEITLCIFWDHHRMKLETSEPKYKIQKNRQRLRSWTTCYRMNNGSEIKFKNFL